MFGRLWRQRRLIVLNCLAAWLAGVLNPEMLAPLEALGPALGVEVAARPATFAGLVLAVSLIVGHLAPRWRWLVFSLVVGYAVGDAAARELTPRMAESLPHGLFILDEEEAVTGPGAILIVLFTIVATLALRMLGGLANTIRDRRRREAVVGGVIRRPREELWAIMAPEMTRAHWNPEIRMVERDRMNPKIGHVVYWRKFGLDHARRVRRIEDEVPGRQFRETIVDDARSTLTRGMSGSVGWLLEDHPKGTYLTMREDIAGHGIMTLLWRWFDDFPKDYFAFLRAHLEGGRDWSLYGLEIVEGEE